MSKKTRLTDKQTNTVVMALLLSWIALGCQTK